MQFKIAIFIVFSVVKSRFVAIIGRIYTFQSLILRAIFHQCYDKMLHYTCQVRIKNLLSKLHVKMNNVLVPN